MVADVTPIPEEMPDFKACRAVVGLCHTQHGQVGSLEIFFLQCYSFLYLVGWFQLQYALTQEIRYRKHWLDT
jgi:hypothetical protein